MAPIKQLTLQQQNLVLCCFTCGLFSTIGFAQLWEPDCWPVNNYWLGPTFIHLFHDSNCKKKPGLFAHQSGRAQSNITHSWFNIVDCVILNTILLQIYSLVCNHFFRCLCASFDRGCRNATLMCRSKCRILVPVRAIAANVGPNECSLHHLSPWQKL